MKCLAAALALSSSFSAIAAPTTYLAPAAERDAAAGASKAYSHLSAKIPTALYDVDGLAERLDYDPEAAIAYVRDEIAYDPYLGVMRGPEGTISAAAGSSWDQAVLLAALINSMAGEAMLVKGKLKTGDAERLLITSLQPRDALPTPLSTDDVTRALKPYVPQAKLASITRKSKEDEASEPARIAGLSKDAADLARRLTSRLNSAGVELATSDMQETRALIDEVAEEYVWVRYRETPNDPWQDIHPAFQGVADPVVTPEEYLAGSVPEDRLHQVEIRLEIERKTGSKLERVSIMEPYRRPAANLARTQISIGITPNTVRPDGEASYFLPIVNQMLPERAQAFTLLGQAASAEDVAAGPAVFATVSGKFGDVAGTLGSTSGDAENAPHLSGVILTVLYIAPGGKTMRVERRLTDFRGGMPEHPSQKVSFHGIFDVNVGPENGARAMKELLDATAVTVRSLPYYKALIDGKITPEDVVEHPAFSAEQTKRLWQAMLLAGNSFNEGAPDGARLLRTAPMISMQRTEHSVNENGIFQQSVDILVDGTRALSQAGGQARLSPQGNLVQGLRTTLVEHSLGHGSENADWRKLRVDTVLKDQASAEAWSREAGFSPWLHDRLMADMAHGETLIMLKTDTVTRPRWWRIDARTGQTLGMGGTGGSALKEYDDLKKFISGGLTAAGLAYGVNSCVSSYSDDPGMLACCTAGNVALTAATGAATNAGNALLAGGLKNIGASALAIVATELKFEVTVGLVSSTLPIPDEVCGAILK
ncbi:hypothetical protein HY29_16975 [Hyphomonas beringensis]|uniref:Uncharacterized protein n=1 Tax=Hyphomonas beringensis TaxID=1280946 RepID=A0A062U5K3_9PROT|nr:hypothetical protein HY29_16975 [Hyphomonas beringensis]